MNTLPSAFAAFAAHRSNQALAMLLYEWVHMLVHTPYAPRSATLKRLKALHTWHHFKHEGYWFGVTATWVDGVMGTRPDPAAIALSPTVKAIHGDS